MKKRIVLVLLLLGCLSTSWTIVEAAEKQSYESNSGIGFYGTYEYPEPEIPNQIPPAGKPSVPPPNQGRLPQTGTTNSSYLTLIGLVLFTSTVLLIVINKNKKQEEIYNEIN
ncbi:MULTISPECIES: LPXTG cell wall anchor domain-containing protein [Carnobacterium]|uniref:Cell wall protein n=1 Tax=Carnobacterium divergens TaxID=2748 RepID=A0A2R8A4F6_CARDV|nr:MULTISPECIES: LPXTG cell wall anchor domain-containing protein [Carnobacterium]MCO6018959.1 LPXTG cell wall anchor domain-containing protein [Carnobacterium divergens]MDT1939448.1 LPXTG cell wall anchor domain-containing protein [Carnobacterium divergens]MDT1941886.1 LPXTG cell wall anchor domain-containing protein [Carnobacterium divergens]MDT1947684.1 LPXTG cell wall anchor domain-containing protein [Carnobacterium divergens]MDT1950172.1 LPXTG cell wall anchor domain-containing protein [C